MYRISVTRCRKLALKANENGAAVWSATRGDMANVIFREYPGCGEATRYETMIQWTLYPGEFAKVWCCVFLLCNNYIMTARGGCGKDEEGALVDALEREHKVPDDSVPIAPHVREKVVAAVKRWNDLLADL